MVLQGDSYGSRQGQATPAREASMSNAIEQFDAPIGRLNEHRMALEQILARVFGPHPTPVQDGKADAPAASIIAGLNTRARYLERLVGEIGELLQRLDQVL